MQKTTQTTPPSSHYHTFTDVRGWHHGITCDRYEAVDTRGQFIEVLAKAGSKYDVGVAVDLMC